MRIHNSLLRLPAAFTERHVVLADEIDEYDHVNNTVYLQWMDRIAWAHSAALGLSLQHCLELRRGMAVRHTRVDYLKAALVGETVLIATWIVACDGRLRCTRRFDMLRGADGERVLEAEIDFFCMNLDSGRPARFPGAFTERYLPLPEVLIAYESLPAEARRLGQWRS
jgi:acyl-CoA thioester hydrolase